MKPEIFELTERLIRALNVLLIDVLVYMVVNLGLILYTFMDISSRWRLLIIVLLWAITVIYHGIRVYGKDPMNQRTPKALSAVIKLMGA